MGQTLIPCVSSTGVSWDFGPLTFKNITIVRANSVFVNVTPLTLSSDLDWHQLGVVHGIARELQQSKYIHGNRGQSGCKWKYSDVHNAVSRPTEACLVLDAREHSGACCGLPRQCNRIRIT
jgi:hypothetical protein